MDLTTIMKRAQEYIAAEKDDFFRNQVEELVLQNNIEELTDRFFIDLEFGTGGMRGVIAGGYNRLNSYMIQKVTQGLANYVTKSVGKGKGSAVIAFDSRHYSDVFALEAAKVLCGAGIKTYLFTSLRPTPELSFAVRQLKATTGIVVTASHNPPAYNGYKVYWNDGAQIVPPHDNAIVEEVKKVLAITALGKDEALQKNLLVMIDRVIDDPFIAAVKAQAVRPEIMREKGKQLKVVFTPLHGTGAMPVSRALAEMGIDVIFVEEQKNPDGNFPTVKYPNPEEATALKMAIDLAKKVNAHLVLATDPDADRLGIAVPDAGGEFVLITGNQLGSLLADYILSGKKEMNTLPEKPVLIKTIVTTELQRRIAASYGVTCIDVLTGFKFIGEKIRELEEKGDGQEYVFGGEESYGYLSGTLVRDKDAVSAATLTAEMTLYAMTQNKSLLDKLNEIYKKHGYFQELLITKEIKGPSGVQAIKAIMERLRKTPPKTMAGVAVKQMKDYGDGTILDMATQTKQKTITLPSANVLQFVLADDSVISARPSGTEPKIKFYASSCAKPGTDLDKAKTGVGAMINAIRNAIDAIIAGT